MSVTVPDLDPQTVLEWWREHHDRRWRTADFGVTPAAAVTASRSILLGDAVEFRGWTVVETTGAASASFRLRDGNADGPVIARRDLNASESASDLWPAPHGIRVETGKIFLQVLSGSVEGVIYWR